MTRKTIFALREQADATLPDNTAQEISPADVRTMMRDIIDTFSPGYGAASVDQLTLPALGITPQIVTYETQLAATAEYTVDLLGGKIMRHSGGLPSTVNRIAFYADVSAPTGNEVVFSLFRDSVDIPGGTTVSGQGLGNVAQAAFSIATTAEDGLDHSYDIRASKVTGGADNVELSNVRFIMEVVPTIGL